MESKMKVRRKIKKKPVMFLGVFVVICIVLFFIWYFLFVPKIRLNGSSYVKIKYGDEYIEEGYEASCFGSDITSGVWLEGEVDTSKVGKYKIILKKY